MKHGNSNGACQFCSETHNISAGFFKLFIKEHSSNKRTPNQTPLSKGTTLHNPNSNNNNNNTFTFRIYYLRAHKIPSSISLFLKPTLCSANIFSTHSISSSSQAKQTQRYVGSKLLLVNTTMFLCSCIS